ncbi:transposase family protein [Streptomyces sp. NPDC048723]|uniref:transposase family protein n=1 Tax=Streptomyces sp. NPDC048723 TaxID=3365589 RepID=UPI0037246D44
MKVETLEDVLFRGLAVVVHRTVVVADGMMNDAMGCGPPGACPRCQHPAARVHSRYWRHIAGLPVGGHRLIVRPGRRLCTKPGDPRPANCLLGSVGRPSGVGPGLAPDPWHCPRRRRVVQAGRRGRVWSSRWSEERRFCPVSVCG